MCGSVSVNGTKWAAHRRWPLVWCSWCRLRTWQRCHFQLCSTLSAWRPVWDTWADGDTEAGDAVRPKHLDNINTWTGAQLRLKTCNTLTPSWQPAPLSSLTLRSIYNVKNFAGNKRKIYLIWHFSLQQLTHTDSDSFFFFLGRGMTVTKNKKAVLFFFHNYNVAVFNEAHKV